tara:strand:- start:432 stop:764 length:333 start_codon:yes stop_codon:yes gene_type:complete
LRGASHDIACIPHPITVAFTDAVVVAVAVVGAIFGAAQKATGVTAVRWETSTIAFGASTMIVVAIFRTRDFRTILTGRSRVTVTGTVETFPAVGATVEASFDVATGSRPR